MHFSRTQSPTPREPLLSRPQTPGMSQRMSQSSFASYNPSSPTMSHRPGAASPTTMGSFASFSSASRFGPTAHLNAQAAAMGSTPGVSGNERNDGSMPTGAGRGGAAIPVDDEDDDLDDHLHTFTAEEKSNRGIPQPFDITSLRGWANALTLGVIAGGGVMLFAGWPIMSWYYDENTSSGSSTSGYNLGGVNSSGQYPSLPGFPSMIDEDTPEWVYTRKGFDGNEWTLVFSDEFEKDGRTFFEGDDPFFTAMDIHYWPTGDFEWYDPSAIHTEDGNLVLTMTQEPIHDLNFKSGMLQSWNKLCFNKNAYFEASVSLPGVSDIGGFWPGFWTMGNLGRPGYGASTEGMWPYTYDTCDIGTLANQTYVNGTGPAATLNTGSNSGPLSYLPGQRCSACTCPGEDHPGPDVSVGRASPEIDIIEAQIIIDEDRGEVSQSFQVAPYDDHYQFANGSGTYEQYDTDLTYFNTYLGGSYQQAVSSLTRIPDDIYYNQEGTSGQFKVFGCEYQAFPDERDKGYITWYADNKTSWTMYADAVAPNSKTEVGRRIIPEEPMAIVFNLAMSNNFQNVDFSHLIWPNYMRIDYLRVYQRSDAISVGCDPDDYPTAQYIADHAEVYANPNLTTWSGAGYSMPKSSIREGC
ncbi:hypothetical protein IAT38_004502 [Cryptococcus sp. DSM 104549]